MIAHYQITLQFGGVLVFWQIQKHLTPSIMALSSIHFAVAKYNSESHNQRRAKLDYTFTELEQNNRSWVAQSISDRKAKIELLALQLNQRKLNKNATPIREAVVNLEAHHGPEDLHHLANTLREKIGIDCFQWYIHRDEGVDKNNLNYHAHMLFDWQDKSTGKMQRHGKHVMAEIQTITADALGMERGREGSTAVRHEAQAYKAVQDKLKAEKAREQAEIEVDKIKNKIADISSNATIEASKIINHAESQRDRIIDSAKAKAKEEYNVQISKMRESLEQRKIQYVNKLENHNKDVLERMRAEVAKGERMEEEIAVLREEVTALTQIKKLVISLRKMNEKVKMHTMSLLESMDALKEKSIKKLNGQYETTRLDYQTLRKKLETAKAKQETSRKEWLTTYEKLKSMKESYPQIAKAIAQQKRQERGRDYGMEM